MKNRHSRALTSYRTPDEWAAIVSQAAMLGVDGCTNAIDRSVLCCYEHDIAYRTGKDFRGQPITRAEADRNFRRCVQSFAKLGKWSPTSYLRWAMVRMFGRGIWGKS